MTKRLLASSLAIAAMLLAGGESLAAQCSAESGARRVPLLELYTSEGCDSCPPTDRWVSGLPGRGLTAGRVVTLAFHVDYWNTLGWADPFAKAEYSARQRTASQRNKARFVHTPQLILDGRDYRRGSFRDDFADRVSAVNQEPARAKISLKLERRRAEQVPGLAGCDPRRAHRSEEQVPACGCDRGGVRGSRHSRVKILPIADRRLRAGDRRDNRGNLPLPSQRARG